MGSCWSKISSGINSSSHNWDRDLLLSRDHGQSDGEIECVVAWLNRIHIRVVDWSWN